MAGGCLVEEGMLPCIYVMIYTKEEKKKKTIGEGMTGRLEVVCLFGYLENCWVRERKG